MATLPVRVTKRPSISSSQVITIYEGEPLTVIGEGFYDQLDLSCFLDNRRIAATITNDTSLTCQPKSPLHGHSYIIGHQYLLQVYSDSLEELIGLTMTQGVPAKVWVEYVEQPMILSHSRHFWPAG